MADGFYDTLRAEDALRDGAKGGKAMARIAIVEDDAAEQARLAGFIRRYAGEHGEQLETTCFSDGEDIVTDYRPCYDIIFLDIQMKRLDGMSAAERIRLLDADVMLIFVTNMAQYAIRGYAVNALDFLLKPVQYFAFSQELARCLARLGARKKDYLLLPTENGVRRLDVSGIAYVESLRHRITVHFSGEELSFSGTMRELEEKLTPLHFFRCNSGYLVNLAQVTGVRESCALVAGEALPISRPRKKAFLDALTDYVGGVEK
jgi:DNA-binding LytR/AlgR family response regulator